MRSLGIVEDEVFGEFPVEELLVVEGIEVISVLRVPKAPSFIRGYRKREW
jgi:hypothetical protein